MQRVIKTIKTSRQLRCELTPEELLEYGEEQAKLLEKNEDLERDKKAFNDQIKSQISGNAQELQQISRNIRNKYEFREVDCDIIKDYDEQTVSVVRNDTFETVESRKM